MSNYTPSQSFGAKDTLPSNDPNKVIYGAQIDTELNAISTAISSKSNVGDKTSTTNALTINDSGSGSSSGTTFDGSSAVTISANTVGALGLTAAVNYLHNTANPGSGVVTITSSNPSGGAAGDIWFQYI